MTSQLAAPTPHDPQGVNGLILNVTETSRDGAWIIIVKLGMKDLITSLYYVDNCMT